MQSAKRRLLHDEELLSRCARGDEVALQQFVQRFGPRVERLGARFFHGPARDDFCQRFFVHLLVADGDGPARIGRCRQGGRLTGFVTRAAYRFAVSLARVERPRPVDGSGWSREPCVDPEQALAARQQQAAFVAKFEAAFAALKPHERRVFKMRFGDGRSVTSISRQLGLHDGSVSRLIARVSRRLRDAIFEPDDTTGSARASEVEHAALGVAWVELIPPALFRGKRAARLHGVVRVKAAASTLEIQGVNRNESMEEERTQCR